MRILSVLLIALISVIAGCKKSAPPGTVPVRTDGVLELSLCSFNIRYESPGDTDWKSWPNRIDRVVYTIRKLDPDVLAVQEARHGQVADIWASIPDYEFHGVGRDDGKMDGEYAGIFFKKNRFEPDPQEQGTFWLSDTPEVPGSKSWGNEVVRYVTWIRLTDRSTGRGFYVFNTHWDHRSRISHEKAAPLITSRIDSRKHPNEPVVLLGDFNATEGAPAVDYLVGSRETLAGKPLEPWPNALTDPYRELHRGQNGRRTLHFWRGNKDGWFKVDHILVSKGAEFLGAGIFHADTRETQPSDHYPVWAKVAWKPDDNNP